MAKVKVERAESSKKQTREEIFVSQLEDDGGVFISRNATSSLDRDIFLKIFFLHVK